MFMRTAASLAIGLGTLHGPAFAGHEPISESDRDTAIEACIGSNDYAPAVMVEAVEDGLGDMLVWVEDRDGDLWMCNADAYGAIYFNVLVGYDILEGQGAELIGLQEAGFPEDPLATAERLCEAVVVEGLGKEVVDRTSVPDGLGDYLVWLETGEGELWACNASGDAALYGFEPVDYPLGTYEPGPAV